MQPLKRVSFKNFFYYFHSTLLLYFFPNLGGVSRFFDCIFLKPLYDNPIPERLCLGLHSTPLSCGCLSLLRLTFQAELFLQPCQILGLQIARPLQYAPSLLQLRA